MKVDIYMPRLDVTFKKGPTPKERGAIPEIRQYWKKFCLLLRSTYIENGHNARLIEVPLWQITVDLVRQTSIEADIIYIPHKMKSNWNLDDRVFYYMQMVIPNIFSIDDQGWCASSSVWPIKLSETYDDLNFRKLSERIGHNVSKFEQPKQQKIKLPSKFILFPCQIPYDETIQYHSDVSVENSLEALIKALDAFPDIALIIKGHPANPTAMKPLEEIFIRYKSNISSPLSTRIYWVNNVSIHQLLNSCMAIFTTNSGVGLEAILHCKRVFTFGNADYSAISKKIVFGPNLETGALAVSGHISSLVNLIDDATYESDCHRFIDSWYKHHADCEIAETFKKFI